MEGKKPVITTDRSPVKTPKISPFPWRYDDSTGTIYDAHDNEIVVDAGLGTADGTLMAAAPELLALLRETTNRKTYHISVGLMKRLQDMNDRLTGENNGRL
jgi:hypothetical protein